MTEVTLRRMGGILRLARGGLLGRLMARKANVQLDNGNRKQPERVAIVTVMFHKFSQRNGAKVS